MSPANNIMNIIFAILAMALLSMAAPLNTTIANVRYGLRCNADHLYWRYADDCASSFFADGLRLHQIGGGCRPICQGGASICISACSADDRGSHALGRDIGNAIVELQNTCTYNGGSMSAAYEESSGKDFIVHLLGNCLGA